MADGGINLYDLAAKISVDASQSDKALTETQKKVLDLAKKFQDTEKKVTDSNKKMGQSELSLAQQMKAVESLQRQRSAALIRQWNEQQRAAKKAADEISRATQKATDDTNSALSTISPKLGAIIGAAGPLTATALAIAAIGAASIGAGVAIYQLVTSVSEGTGKFIDLAQQTGFSVETLSALSNAAETSGGSIESVTASLNIFQAHMVDAREKGSEMSKLFKQLNIDTENNEKALRQALTAITNLSRAEDQAAVGKKLLGRSFKELLAATKDAGNLDAYLNEQLRKGTLVTTDMAKRGDQLSDSVIEMGRAFEAARRIIASQFGPDVLKVVKEFTKALEDNRATLSSWANDIRLAIHGAVDPLAASLSNLNNILLNIVGIPIPRVLEFLLKYGSGAGLIFTGLKAIGEGMQGPTLNTQAQADILKMTRAFMPASQQYKSLGKPFERVGKPFEFPSGGGGGGGSGPRVDPAAEMKKLLDVQMRMTLESLRREESDIERSYDKRKLTVEVYERALTRLEEERHKAVLDALKSEETEIGKSKKLKGLQLSTALQELELKRLQEANRHREAEYKLEDSILKITRERIATVQKLIETQTRLRYSSDVILQNLGGGSVQVNEDTRGATTRPRSIAEGATRPRIATVEMQVFREQMEIFREKIRSLAQDLTYSIDRGIYEGFHSGVKKGIAEFGRGILEMINSSAMRALEKKLEELLASIATSSSGKGGFLGILSKIIIPIIGGAVAPAAPAGGFIKGGTVAGGTLGKFAGGGDMNPFSWALVGERGPELVRAGRSGATVLSNEQSFGQRPIHVVQNFHITTPNGQVSRETQAQLARQASRALQKVALTG